MHWITSASPGWDRSGTTLHRDGVPQHSESDTSVVSLMRQAQFEIQQINPFQGNMEDHTRSAFNIAANLERIEEVQTAREVLTSACETFLGAVANPDRLENIARDSRPDIRLGKPKERPTLKSRQRTSGMENSPEHQDLTRRHQEKVAISVGNGFATLGTLFMEIEKPKMARQFLLTAAEQLEKAGDPSSLEGVSRKLQELGEPEAGQIMDRAVHAHAQTDSIKVLYALRERFRDEKVGYKEIEDKIKSIPVIKRIGYRLAHGSIKHDNSKNRDKVFEDMIDELEEFQAPVTHFEQTLDFFKDDTISRPFYERLTKIFKLRTPTAKIKAVMETYDARIKAREKGGAQRSVDHDYTDSQSGSTPSQGGWWNGDQEPKDEGTWNE